MKAKEYNKEYREEHKEEMKKDESIIAIFNEMNTKGNAFVRNANKEHKVMLRNDAFKKFVTIRDKDFAKLIGWL